VSWCVVGTHISKVQMGTEAGSEKRMNLSHVEEDTCDMRRRIHEAGSEKRINLSPKTHL